MLTTRPETFQGYALMSPALMDFPSSPGEEQLVEAVRAGSIPDGTAVFLSVGELEEEPDSPLAPAAMISNAHRMRAALAGHGVRTRMATLPGESHISALGAAVTRALRFLVPPA